MNKFRFEHTSAYENQPKETIVVETNAEDISGVVDAMQSFLRAVFFDVNLECHRRGEEE